MAALPAPSVTVSETVCVVLLASAAVAAALLGYGLGWAFAIAIIGCGAMLVALLWLINVERHRSDHTGIEDETHEDARHSAGS